MITVKNLYKEFQIPKRKQNFKDEIKYFFKREYYIKEAVKDVSFHIPSGEIIGLVGPNGAGKSTIIKMLSGILLPTSGTLRVFGLNPFKNHIEVVKRIGTVFGQNPLVFRDMPVLDSLELTKYMYRISEKQYKENLELFCHMLGLEEFLKTPVSQLSLGQRMRADFACANLHNPELIFLDEPTIGLDLIAKQKIRDFICEINKTRNTTIVLTTHDASEIQRLCSRVLVLDSGQLVFSGNLERMKATYASVQNLQVEISNRKLPDLQDLPIIKYKISNWVITITYDTNVINSNTILSYILRQCHIKDIKEFQPSFHDVILAMYEKLPPIS
jgi:ABC-2 type transport system ATP-binding protein